VENTKFLPNDLNLKFKNQMMVCKSYEMDQELSLSLLKKHNGDLQKVLFDYYSKKSFPKDHKVNFSKNTKKDYKNKMIICRSYKMDEDLSFELLQKHDGNLQKVLFDYYSKKISSKGS